MLKKPPQACSPNYQEHTAGEPKVRQLALDAVEMLYQHSSSPLSIDSKMILPVSVTLINEQHKYGNKRRCVQKEASYKKETG